MRVRLAEEKDVKDVMDLFTEYANEGLGEYNITLDTARAEKIVRSSIDRKCGFVLIEDDKIVGGMAGYIVESFFSDDVFMQSIFFYIKKPYRSKAALFIKSLEIILRATKVTKFIIANIETNNGEKLERFYKMLGFKKLETHYIKGV